MQRVLQLLCQPCLRKDGALSIVACSRFLAPSHSNIRPRTRDIFNRPQLCAVWVTTSAAPPPFEVLNDSHRKYDALRLKYIQAFIDCMKLCERKDKIEELLTNSTAGNWDLPGFYEASASLQGGEIGKHFKYPLLAGSGRGFLTKVKRAAISALGEMILRDLAALKQKGVDNEGKVKLIQLFKLSYSLFRRMNTSSKDIVEYTTKWGPLQVVNALGKCYMSIQSGYRISNTSFDEMDSDTLCSIIEGAVAKAKEMILDAKDTAKKSKDTEATPNISC